jgi:hypothetical protein
MSEEGLQTVSPEELPHLSEDFWDDAEIVTPPPKKAFSIRIDEDVPEWFRSQGPGYQTRMNAVLRSFVEAQKSGGAAVLGRLPRTMSGANPPLWISGWDRSPGVRPWATGG